ncbi:hypothetical protein SZ25_00612 [Candidatus Arcanobacter lacustris]|uniref:Nudix hydrolase domain-containing protein n=1 Tax=Candidatus Arcanibacter lacustris TaxID=1607817 RepID=A0A0F5MND9_9RICK|nr:hypothetical protein SZ25_00612 [Candidatus Arcanobacter lacustris]
MHRNKLLNLINNFNPKDLMENNHKNNILNFINNNKDCFERSLSEGHITGSCWLINHDNSKFLLLHHQKLDIWVQPGGHADGDSDILGVTIKEAQEETGIIDIEPVSDEIFDIDIHKIPANSKDAAHLHYDVRFLLRVKNDQEPIRNRESKDIKWFDKNTHSLPTSELSVTRMHDKWLELEAY